MALVDIQVPDIGDFDEVAVIELLVKVGDTVKAEQSLITVESDKASMEIPSSGAGVVKELLVKLGDKVKQGVVIARLDSDAAPAEKPAAPAAASAPESKPAPAAAAAPAPAADSSGPVKVLVPDIGDFKDVAVIEVLVKVGDTVKLEQSLVTVESDKASMEIPSNVAGVVKEITVKLGDKVREGQVLGSVIDPVTNTGSAILAPFNGRILGMAVNQVVQTGFATHHVGVETAAEKVQEEAIVEDLAVKESVPPGDCVASSPDSGNTAGGC